MRAGAHDQHRHGAGGGDLALLGPGEWLVAALLAGLIAAYLLAVLSVRRRDVGWSPRRTASWVAGWVCVGVAVVGPVAERAHQDFATHMAGHVLLGMLGPLLLVLAAPVTLTLRALPVRTARPIARFLASGPIAVLTDPFLAALLNIGGLWVLYRTSLHALMHTEPALHALVHLHVLAAGYLFTFAVIGGPDPAPHRRGPAQRATALVLAVAAHNVLAKSLYATPPSGVPVEQAQAGAQLMYYAGAPVEVALMVLCCGPWLLPRRRGTRLAVP